MASACNRIAQRALLSSIKSTIKSNIRTSSFPKPTATSSPLRRSFSSRIAPELGCVQSMLPLHSADAVARMTSRLSITSTNSRSLSQGTYIIGSMRDQAIKAYFFSSLVYQFQGDFARRNIEESLLGL